MLYSWVRICVCVSPWPELLKLRFIDVAIATGDHAYLSRQVFDEQTGCGVPPPAATQPSSTKSKRSVISYNPNLPLRHRGKARLRALIRAVRQGLTDTKDLWGLGLSSSVCSKMAAANSDVCWNGEDGARCVWHSIMYSHYSPRPSSLWDTRFI